MTKKGLILHNAIVRTREWFKRNPKKWIKYNYQREGCYCIVGRVQAFLPKSMEVHGALSVLLQQMYASGVRIPYVPDKDLRFGRIVTINDLVLKDAEQLDDFLSYLEDAS